MLSVLRRSAVAAGLCMVLVSAAPGYREVEPMPRVRLEIPAGWQEHRRDGDVVYAPPGVDYRAPSLAYGVRVFTEQGDANTAARRLEMLLAAYAKANPGLRPDGPYLVEPGLTRASANFSHAPSDDPTVRETGWILVSRLANGRWLCAFAVMPEAERLSNAGVLGHMRASLVVGR